MDDIQSLKLFAPAKINLTLKVLGKRADGYHELETWMQKLSLSDEIDLAIHAGVGIDLHCESDEVPCDETNLVCQAAKAFLEHVGMLDEVGVSILLKKNIPTAAGLGGGSSDAAAVLKGLNSLLGGSVDQQMLENIGLSLGADVPFFVSDYQAVIATGVGEKMKEVPSLRDVTVLLVNPGIAVSTKWVFENFVLTEKRKKSIFSLFSETGKQALNLEILENDLEVVTETKYPVIKDIKDSLLRAGAVKAQMSGSGPTVFGIFPDVNKKCCIEVEDALKTMRLRFGNKAYRARTSAGA